MLRHKDDAKKFGTKTINCLIADNGIGDMLAAFPAINYIVDNFSWINLLVWVPDHMLELAKNVLNPKAVIRDYTDAATKYDNTRGGITTKWDKRVSPMRMHPVDYAFITLCDVLPLDMKIKNYPRADISKVNLKKFKLPEKYVIIQATATETVKSMPVSTANELSEYVVKKGYTPVYIGKTLVKSGHKNGDKKAHDLGIDKTLGLDLVDKASLLESIAIISGAKCFIGVDGGSLHMAAFTDIPLVVYYSFINPAHNMPIRNGEIGWNCFPIIPEIACKFCQSNVNFIYGRDYRDCLYGDFKCIKECTSDKYIKILEDIL